MSDQCEADKNVLNTAAGTGFRCSTFGRGGTGNLVGCTSQSMGRVNQYVDLNGCNGQGDFVPSGSSGFCTCNAFYGGEGCQIHYANVGTCDSHGTVNGITGSCSCNVFYGGDGCQIHYTDAGTCNAHGTVNATTGSCSCNGGAAGPHCEHSNAATCSGSGTAQFDGSCSCREKGTWTLRADNPDCTDSGRPTLLLIGLLVAAAVVLAVVVVSTVPPARARVVKRRAADAHGRAHPMTVRTIAGDLYVVAGWGATKDLRQTVSMEHPELGKPNGFVLLLDGTVVVDGAAYGTPAHTSLLRSVGPIELILRYTLHTDAGVAEHQAPAVPTPPNGHSTVLELAASSSTV